VDQDGTEQRAKDSGGHDVASRRSKRMLAVDPVVALRGET